MLPILYRDQQLIAVHKPAGLLVHRSDLDRHETRFAVQLLRDQIGQPVFPAHRLDRGTSGVLLFALDRGVLPALTAQFETRQVEKHYMAVVRGWPAEEGLIDHPLPRIVDDYERGKPQALVSDQARTRFRRLATAELPVAVDRYPTSRYAWLTLSPETGRRHQLRRHLKHISHPIIGDATYGKGRHNRAFQQRFGSRRLLLACTALRLTHPLAGTPLRIEARPSDDFIAVLQQLGWAWPETETPA